MARTIVRRLAVVMLAAIGSTLAGSGVAWAAIAPPEIISPHPNQVITSAPVEAIGVTDVDGLVEIYEAGVQVGGGFSEGGLFQIPMSLANGTHTIVARLIAGVEVSPWSNPVTFVVDLAPSAPVFTQPAAGARLNSTTVTIAGTAAAGTTVTLRENGVVIAPNLPVSGSGAWSATRTFSEATHTVTATATDASGRTSPSSSRTFTVDVTAPAAPSIASPAAGSYLNTSTATISGAAEANATVRLYDAGVLKGSTTASSSGAWSRSVSGLGEGAHSFTARATDAAGNTGPSSPPRTFTVDTTAPAVAILTPDPSVFLPGRDVVDGTASDAIRVARIRLTYRTPAGVVARAVDASCAGCGSTSAAWSDAAGLGAGVYEVEAVAFDAAGNPSPPASITILVV